MFLCGEYFRHYKEIKDKKYEGDLKDGDHFVGQTYKMTGRCVAAMCVFVSVRVWRECCRKIFTQLKMPS